MSTAGGLEWRKLNAHRRLLVALVVAVTVALLAPGGAGVPARLTGSWDAGVIVFLALTWLLVRRCPPDEVQRTVLANDQGRVAVLVLVLLATAASFSAIFFLLRQAKSLASWALVLHIGLAVATIVCSWLMTHVMFALHYAHRFYRDDPRTPDQDATGQQSSSCQ